MGRFDGIEETIVFGSRAMGNRNPGSDVGIAFRARNVAMDLSTLLNEKLPHYYDVVYFRCAGKRLADQSCR